jgi:hypothetical protein
MWNERKRSMACALGIIAAGLVCLPTVAFAQTAPSMMVQRTSNYTLVLSIGPVETMVSPMDAMHGMTGEVAVTGGPMNHDAGMMSDNMDQGMAANHHLEVQITQAATGNVVMDVTPTIRITDKLSGTSRDLPQVMGMYGAAMGPSDFHYGQNVYLPDGTYMVTVLVGPSDTAQFRDVVVMASPMMADHDMGMAHDMSVTEGTARDGRMFKQEPAATQTLFTSVWGAAAATEWVKQHNLSLP